MAAIVGALVGTGVGPALADGISTQVCRITGGGDCGGGGDTVAEDDQGGEGGEEVPPGGTDDPASDTGNDSGGKSQTEIDYDAALKELQDAQAAETSDSDKAKEAAKELAKILADELGITDALDCITKGDMGACTETLINVLLSVVGGAVGKLAAKYGAPWKWKKAVELVRKLKKHGGDLYDGLKGLIKNRKRVDEAEDRLADAKKKLDQENKDKPKDKDVPVGCTPKHSFLPGTSVLLADGRRMAIDKVRVGMRVVATDPQNGRTEARTVEHTITTHQDKDFTRLTVVTGSGTEVLTATDTHPFWLTDKGRWADAGDIAAGDDLRTPAGTSVQVTAVAGYTKRQTTHDLTVNGIHTYYVLAGETPVLVHNTPPGTCSITTPADAPVINSKTVYKSKDGTFRVDIENQNPGKPGAGIHVQFMGRGADPKKYYFDPADGKFRTETGEVLSSKLAKQVPRSAIDKAYQYFGMSAP
ncbi:polymorphic toxin-type HINT domain-containing protein [Streptomyces sp. NPDC058653]|uniref:polymorphic toxin-type HINT domain-containing protein n=1 Tax=Streptomyces sp. NPDC058653 TaxID=3346576 RepID=UPI0036629D0D